MGPLVDAVAIPAAVLLLVAGTLAFVVVLTVAARVVDRLWPQPREERTPEPRRARAVSRRTRVVRLSPLAATMLAAALLLTAAWSVTLVLRIRDLF